MQFYQERADQSRKEAQEASLDNVRDRCLSAAQAWDAMADRMKRTQVYRDAHAVARAERPDEAANPSPPNEENETDHHESTELAGASRPAPAYPPAAH